MANSLDYAGGASIQLPDAPGVKVSPTNWGGIERQSMKTLDALNQLTQGLLKPAVDQLEKTQFYEGMSKVVQGQTLKEIEDSDPWYMNIVGPSATVRGAQAMTATTALQQAETDFMQAMPTLRSQSPEEARKFLVDKASSLKSTGDPLIDATVQAKLIEGMGPMLKTHVREHMAWTQEDMFDKYTTANVSVGQNLKATRHATGTGWTPEDRAAAYANTVESAAPLPGQSPDSWNKAIATSLRSNLTQGNFDYYEAIKNSPLYEKIDPALRADIEGRMPQFVHKDAMSNPDIQPFTNSIAGFEYRLAQGATGFSTEAELNAFIDRSNTEATGLNGSTQPFINNQQRAQYIESFYRGADRRQAHAQALLNKEATKDAEVLATTTAVTGAFSTGNYSSLEGLPLNDGARVAALNGISDQMLGGGNPEQTKKFFAMAAASSYNPKLIVPRMEQMLRQGSDSILNGAGPLNPTQVQSIGWMAHLYKQPNGPEALSRYIGSDNAAKVASMLNNGMDPQDPEQVKEQRLLIKQGGTARPTEAEVKEVRSHLREQAGKGLINSVFGGGQLEDLDLSNEAMARTAQEIAPEAAQHSRAYGIPMEAATRIVAAKRLKAADLVPGAVIFSNPMVRGEPTLYGAVNRLTTSQAGAPGGKLYQGAVRSVVDSTLTEKMKAAGADMSNFKSSDWEVRHGDQMGEGILELMLFQKDNPARGPVRIIVRPDAVAAAVKAGVTKEATRSTRAIQQPAPVQETPQWPYF